MSDADINEEEFCDLLHARRDELQHMQAIRTEAGKTVELDQQRTGRLSRMDALQGQAMAITASASIATSPLRSGACAPIHPSRAASSVRASATDPERETIHQPRTTEPSPHG